MNGEQRPQEPYRGASLATRASLILIGAGLVAIVIALLRQALAGTELGLWGLMSQSLGGFALTLLALEVIWTAALWIWLIRFLYPSEGIGGFLIDLLIFFGMSISLILGEIAALLALSPAGLAPPVYLLIIILIILGSLIGIFATAVWVWRAQLLMLRRLYCDWVTEEERRCLQWVTQQFQECANWAIQHRQECAQWRNQQVQRCAQWSVINQCNQPSVLDRLWCITINGLKKLVVCVFWTVVVYAVCVAWVLVAYRVCQLWISFWRVYCTAWATIRRSFLVCCWG